MPELSVDHKSCTRCGLCTTVCPWRIIVISDGKPPCFDGNGPDRCSLCGHCEAACPSGSITVDDPRLESTVYSSIVSAIEPENLAKYLRMRRSVRQYREEPVDRRVIEKILDIVRFAPTGRNMQDVCWLIIHDTAEVRRLTRIALEWMREMSATGSPLAARFNVPGMVRDWEAGKDPLCQHAPHLVVAHAREDLNPVARTNAIIALAHLDIIAPAYGLGACWAGIFQLTVNTCGRLRDALDLPAGHSPIHFMMLGYPAIHYWRPPKRNRLCIDWR